MKRSMAMLVAAALAACAHAQPPKESETRAESPTPTPTPAPAPAAGSVDLVHEARQAVKDVCALRGLPEKTPLDIRVESLADFKAGFQKFLAREADDFEKTRAEWVVFGLAGPEVDPKAVEASVLDEQVAGYYDFESKALHVPSALPPAMAEFGPEVLRSILAHEIEHALQDQAFGIPDFRALPDDDVRLARSAVLEGDATLTMILAQLHGQQLPREQLVQRLRQLDQLPSDVLLQIAGKNPEILQAPMVVRATMLFPYIAGARFTGELYAAGGWELVDRMFRAPPESSEQLIHPEKYVAGEPAVTVEAPALPGGEKEVSHGRIGELGMRILLEQCLGAKVGDPAAQGWGGDAYLISEQADGALTLAWSTAWDSEADAREFEAAAKGLGSCWKASALPAPSTRHVSADVAIVRQGRRVAVVRGIPATAARARTEALLRLPHEPAPDAPPLGKVTLVPPAPAQAPVPVASAPWSSDELGLSLVVPEGFSATVTGNSGFAMQRASPPAMGSLTFVAAAMKDAVRPTIIGFRGGLERHLPKGVELVEGPVAAITVGGRASEQHVWTVQGRPLMWLTIVPACGQRGFFTIAQSAIDPASREVLDRWMDSIAFHGEPKACPAAP